jgi:hypothetical protein
MSKPQKGKGLLYVPPSVMNYSQLHKCEYTTKINEKTECKSIMLITLSGIKPSIKYSLS